MNQSLHHSCTFSHISYKPYAFGSERRTGSGPCFQRSSYAGRDCGESSPHGKSLPSTPARAARSHSASVGRRNSEPIDFDSHWQYATASNHETAVTGCSGWLKFESVHVVGKGWPLASRKRAYSATGDLGIGQREAIHPDAVNGALHVLA